MTTPHDHTDSNVRELLSRIAADTKLALALMPPRPTGAEQFCEHCGALSGGPQDFTLDFVRDFRLFRQETNVPNVTAWIEAAARQVMAIERAARSR